MLNGIPVMVPFLSIWNMVWKLGCPRGLCHKRGRFESLGYFVVGGQVGSRVTEVLQAGGEVEGGEVGGEVDGEVGDGEVFVDRGVLVWVRKE